MRKLTQQEVEKRVTKSGLKLLGVYKGSFVKVLVKCLVCSHRWKVIPSNVLHHGNGCPKCAGLRPTKQEIAKRAAGAGTKLVGPFVALKTKVKVKCTTCGHTWKTLLGSGCPECSHERRREAISGPKLSHQQMAKRAAKVGVQLLEPYKSVKIKVKVKCLTCDHTWEVLPNSFKSGVGCPVCANSKKMLTAEEVTKRANKAKVEILDEYQGMFTKVRWGCKRCGSSWSATPDGVFRGSSRCTKCYPHKFGTSEAKIRKSIEHLTGWKFPKNKPDFLKGRNGYPLELDGYNQRHKVAFEYQGPQHYQPIRGLSNGEDGLAALKKRDERKRALCYQNGVTLIRVPYWKQDVEDFIRTKLLKAGVKLSS